MGCCLKYRSLVGAVNLRCAKSVTQRHGSWVRVGTGILGAIITAEVVEMVVTKTRSILATFGLLLAVLMMPASVAAKEATVALEISGMT